MIRVHQVDGDRRIWYGFIHHRHPRPDVVAAQGHGFDATILGEPGFTVGFRLDLPPGRYRLSVLHPRQHSVASVMIPGQFHVVP